MKDLVKLDTFKPEEVKVTILDASPDTFCCNPRTYARFLKFEGFEDYMTSKGLELDILFTIRDNYVYLVDSARIEIEVLKEEEDKKNMESK